MPTIAQRIKQLREKNGTSVIKLANKIGISRHSVYKWENGISAPQKDHLKLLSEIFNTDIDYIISGISKASASSHHIDSSKYIERLESANSFSSIKETITDFLKEIGLDKFTYNQIFRGDTSNEPQVTIITNIRKDWQIHYSAKKYIEIDPTWNYATTHTAPIFCDELIDLVASSDKNIQLFFKDMRENLAPYFVVIPIHGPCCLATYVVSAKDNSRLSKEKLHNSIESLTHFSHYIFEATHKVAEKKSIHHKTSLTKKEISTINYLANGLTIKQIAEKNFITIAAVNARISNAKAKMDAQNCEQLVLLAASAGILPHNFGKMRKIKA